MTAISCGVQRPDFGVDVAASIRRILAGNLRVLLKAHKLNQRQFASAIDVDESLISNWLKEKNFPSEENFNKIVDTFGLAFMRALLASTDDVADHEEIRARAKLAKEKRALVDAAKRVLEAARDPGENN